MTIETSYYLSLRKIPNPFGLWHNSLNLLLFIISHKMPRFNISKGPYFPKTKYAALCKE